MSVGQENSYYARNNNGKKKEVKEPTTYSLLKFNNPDSMVDQTALRFQFMYGLLNVSIAPKKGDSNGDYANYDYNNKIEIWMSYVHAYILKQEIERLLSIADPKKLKTVGVATKKDVLINFGYGIDYGTNNFILSLTELESDGSIKNSYVYEFYDNNYVSIVNFDSKTKKFEKNQITGLEVNMFLTILDEYIKSSTGSYAYMNRYYNRFETSDKFDMLSNLCKKFDIPVPYNNGKANYSKKESFFNGNKNSYNNYDQSEYMDENNYMNPPAGNKQFKQSTMDEITEEYE